MANHNLGTIRGTIEIDYDGAGIVRAVRDTDKAKKELGGLDKASTKILGVFSGVVKGFLKVGGAVNLVTSSVSFLSSALAAVGPLIGAGLAAAPAVILSFASAFAVAKIAVSGMGDALAAAAGPANLFNDAIKNLAPNAQNLAKGLQQAMPQLKAAKKEIQNAFFSGADVALGKVIKGLLQLTGAARQVAFAMGQVAQNIVKTATNSKNIQNLRAILLGVSDFLTRIKNAIGPVVTGFINLAAQGGKFGGILGGQVAKALNTFAIWLNGIDLDAVFQKALPIIQSLGVFLSNIGVIAKSLFGIFVGDGGNAVGVIGQLATQLAIFLQSAQGVQLINALQQALQAISTGAGQIFLALLQALTPAIVALLPGITQLAGQITSALVPAINALAPLLLQLAQFLSDNMGWLGPVAGAVVVLAGAYKTYAAAAKVVAAVQGVLQAKMVGAAAVWTAQKIAIIASTAATAANAVVTGTTAVAAWVANTAAVVANKVATGAVALAMGVVRVATIAWTAVQWALNAAMSANPIGLVVAAIAVLVAGIILLWKHSETFRTIVLAVWAAIKVAITAVVNWFMGTAWPIIKRVIDFIIGYYKFLWQVTKAVWTAIWNVIKAIFNAIVADVKAKIATIKSIINGIKTIIAVIRNAFTNAKNAAVNMLVNLINFVRSIPGKITSALGNLGNLLYNKGKQIIQGFINGIGAMIGAVRDKASSIVHAVTDFLPGSPAKRGPLSGRGYVLLRARRFMNDFAKGLDDGSQKPTVALMGTVTTLGRAVAPTVSTAISGPSSAVTTPVGAGGTREYHLDIDGKTFSTIVVDTITGNPVAVKKANDRGNQLTSWAGAGR